MKVVIDIPDNFNLENEINTVSNSVIRKALKNGTPLLLNEFEDIMAKYKYDFALVSKKIDEWCIQTMRGIVGSYYADKMLNEIDKEDIYETLSVFP